MKIVEHFKTITHHKFLVMINCFKVGLFRQGLLHDLSKYSPAEFFIGCHYYQGDRSPNAAERDEKGYSEGWMHHKGRNKHHYEYWTDIDVKTGRAVAGVIMPMNYLVEMLMDRIAASRTYEKERYTDASALNYYNRTKRLNLMHPDTDRILVLLLHMLKKAGEKKTFRYIRAELLRYGYNAPSIERMCEKYVK